MPFPQIGVLTVFLIAVLVLIILSLLWLNKKSLYAVTALGSRSRQPLLKKSYVDCMNNCVWIDANENLKSNLMCVRACDDLFK